MKLLGRYINGNTKTTIFSDGTRIRETEDDEFVPAFADNMDIKITDACDMGCLACHEGSTLNGKHADILNEKFIDTLHPFQEVACVSGDSIVFGDNGAIEVKDLNVGDMIYDDAHVLRKIVSITKENKPTYLLSGDKGFRIKCSEDHPFICDGKQVVAKKLIGKSFDRLNAMESKREIVTIDMSKYKKEKTDKRGSVGGADISTTEVRTHNSTKSVPRYINLNNDLMYLYGWYVAEGSSKGLTMNIKEKDIAENLGNIWKNAFFNEYKIYEYPEKNSLALELKSKEILKDFFVKELQCGEGARNKSISYLFRLKDSELIRMALLGLFDGDGCYRTRIKNGCQYNVASLKTTSRKLAYEVVYILARTFGIYASVMYGVSPERMIEGRKLDESDYYAVEIYGTKNLSLLFPERFDFKIVQQQSSSNGKFRKIEKIEDEILYDITLDSGSHIFPINGYVLTHNCGGGDATSHPDLIPFLEKLREKKVIANMTVNQRHFEQKQDLIRKLIEEKLIWGLGVSLVAPTPEFISLVKQYPNAVIHVINGLFTEDELDKLQDHGLKILILGYKRLRRGERFYQDKEYYIAANMEMLKGRLGDMISRFNVVSFDNLAITQLGVQNMLSPEDWERFYAGDDGTHTYYIDMVNRKFAQSSTAPFDERYDLLDSVDEMFDVITRRKAAA